MRNLLIAACFLLFVVIPAHATVWSTDCSTAASIQAQINSGSTVSGDTVKCNNTAGSSFSWSAQVTIPSTKGITIDGTVGITLTGDGFQLNQNSTTSSRITGFTFTNQANCGSASTPIQTQNTSSTPFADASYRIDHNTFSNTALSVFMCLNGDVRGLVDHNTLSGGPASEMIHIFGNNDWNTTDVTPGSANAVFIEDNTFTFLTGPAANYAQAEEAFNAAVFVFRHNTLNNTCNDIHNGSNGGRWWEIYQNTYNDTGSPYCFADVRGGSGVYWGNAAAAAAANRVAQFGQSCPPGSDTCSGNWPITNQVGRGINQNYSPGYAWGNSAFIPIVPNSSSNWVNIGAAPTDNSLCSSTANNHTAGVCDVVSTATKPPLLERCESAADVAAGCPVSYVYTPYIYPNPLQNQPTLVQHVSSAMEGNDTSSIIAPSLTITLPNTTGGGNLLIACAQESVAQTVSVTDDKGNTWFPGPSRVGANQLLSLFYAPNVASGTQKITFTYSGNATFTQVTTSEFYNVAQSTPGDGSISGSSSAAGVTAGTLTTASDGDLIYQCGVDDTNVGTLSIGTITGFTAGTNFSFLSADRTNGPAAQYQVQGLHGAISPSFAVGGITDTYDTVVMAFTSAGLGTPPPAGIRIVHVYHWFGQRNNNSSNPNTVNFPATGNLIVATNASGRATFSSLTDSDNNTYTAWHSTDNPGDLNQGASIAYAVNATTDTNMTITVNWTPTPGGGHNMGLFYDITGAAVNPHDVDGQANGNQGCGPPFTLITASLTPTTANGLVIGTAPVFQSTMNGMSGAGFVGDMVVNPHLDQGNTCGGTNTPPSNLDEDNGFGHYYNPNTNTVTLVYTTTPSAVGFWTAAASAFKAPPQGCSGNPVVGNNGIISATNNTSSSTTLLWTKATDPCFAQNLLSYEICQSTVSNISTIAGCEANLIQSFLTDINQVAVTVTVRNATWFFNVVVQDPNGNKTAYSSQQISLCAALEPGPILFMQQRADATPPRPCNPVQ